MLWEQELIAIGTGTSYALDAEVGATHLFSQNRGPYCLWRYEEGPCDLVLTCIQGLQIQTFEIISKLGYTDIGTHEENLRIYSLCKGPMGNFEWIFENLEHSIWEAQILKCIASDISSWNINI